MAKILSNNKRTLDELIPEDKEEQKIFRPLKVQKLEEGEKETEQELDEEDEEEIEEFKSMPLELKTMPTLFICINDWLDASLQCVAKITGTSAFNKLITNPDDFGIESPIHLIHDPSMKLETISLTIQYFMFPFGYSITTEDIETRDLPEKIRSLENIFSDEYIDHKERLIQMRGNFNNWTCPFNRIVINQYYPEIYEITEIVRHVDVKTDKIIFVMGFQMILEELQDCIEDTVSSLKTQYDGLLILVDEDEKESWTEFKKSLKRDSVLYHTGRKDLYQRKLVLNSFIYNDFETEEVTNHINKFLLQ